METISESSIFYFLRSCTKETHCPIEGKVKGEVPKWLKGSLVRVGSGLLQVGPDHYNHVFDGLALLHRFGIQDGKVTYRNKFLRSDTYRRNMKANRIVVPEFATNCIPDPCKTIFQRFFSFFSLDMTDNDLVAINLFADEAYACSETNNIWKIDSETLESVQKVKLNDFVPINAAIAHPHKDKDGTIYNIGSTYSIRSSFKVLKFPPRENKTENPFQNGTVVSTIPAISRLSVSYHHSFGITENYVIFVEQPLYMYLPKILKVHFFGGGSYADAMYWDENVQTRIHVVRKSDGKRLKTKYVAKSFFVFHHINAYEEDDHLVVDMCTYDSGNLIKVLYVKALEEHFEKFPNKFPSENEARAKRYVLPLMLEETEKNENLVKLHNSKATAIKLKDSSIFVTPEILIDSWSPELPRINYDNFNGRMYRYFYGIAQKEQLIKTYLIKADLETKSVVSWSEEGAIPSEPIFIPENNSLKEEDSGVILASLLYNDNKNKVSLLILDAKTMAEKGRVTFDTESSVPGDYHGAFISN